MRAIALAAALAALPVSQVALAAETAATACVTERDVAALTAYGMPSVISGVTRSCAKALPAESWLPRNGEALAARYAAQKPRAWPAAKAAFMRLSQVTNPDAAALFAAMTDDALMPIADAAVAGIVSSKLKPESCPAVDRALSLLSPLPPENTAELIALAVGLTARAGEPRIGKLSICKA